MFLGHLLQKCPQTFFQLALLEAFLGLNYPERFADNAFYAGYKIN